jgi:hypothetical protein
MSTPKGLPNGHSRRNLSRRQLLGHGLGLGIGMALTTPLTLLFGGRQAHAGTPTTRLPFLSIDGAGGGNIAGSNVIVGKKGGQLDFLTTYDYLGLPDEMHPSKSGQIDNSMGLAFHADSAFLRGIKAYASASTLASVDGFIVPGFSLDDSHENQQSPAHWIYSWGRRGILAQLIGNSTIGTGGNIYPPQASAVGGLSPVTVTSAGGAVNIAAVGNMQSDLPYDTRGNNDRAGRVLRATGKLHDRFLQGIPQGDLADFHRDNMRKSYAALTTALGVSMNSLDPSQDAIVTKLYPTVMNPPVGDEGTMCVSIVKLLLDGFAGCGAITLPGFDYHTGERATGELADVRLGNAIGLALEMAAQKNQSLFIQVSTDGAQNSYRQSIDNSPDGRGKFGWAGDSGTHGAVFCLVYKAGGAGRPPILKEGRQYGAFVDGGGADMAATAVAGLPERQAAFMFLNYLALHGAEGDYAQLLGTANPLPAPLSDHLYFGSMFA